MSTTITFSVETEVPSRPAAHWDVVCPYCGSSEAQCLNPNGGARYSSYVHQPRWQALIGAQQMHDKFMKELTG